MHIAETIRLITCPAFFLLLNALLLVFVYLCVLFRLCKENKDPRLVQSYTDWGRGKGYWKGYLNITTLNHLTPRGLVGIQCKLIGSGGNVMSTPGLSPHRKTGIARGGEPESMQLPQPFDC